MSISEDEIDKQIAQHRYRKNTEYFDEYRSQDLCAGAVCHEYVDRLSDCCECIGEYSINILFEVQPALTWENLKETILIAQVLTVLPQP
jgi:hypothetical protein